MAQSAPIFTVDWENWCDGLHIEGDNRVKEPTIFLLEMLDKYGVKAIFFCLGKTIMSNVHLHSEIVRRGHKIQSHGFHHIRGESSDRQPYAWLGLTGGLYFRLFPLSFIKKQVLSNGQFYIHPHDIDEGHPKINNPILNWKRHVGLKDARRKLDTLLSDITWGDPNG